MEIPSRFKSLLSPRSPHAACHLLYHLLSIINQLSPSLKDDLDRGRTVSSWVPPSGGATRGGIQCPLPSSDIKGSVELPLLPAEAAASFRSMAARWRAAGEEPPRLLDVDDDADSALLLRCLLINACGFMKTHTALFRQKKAQLTCTLIAEKAWVQLILLPISDFSRDEYDKSQSTTRDGSTYVCNKIQRDALPLCRCMPRLACYCIVCNGDPTCCLFPPASPHSLPTNRLTIYNPSKYAGAKNPTSLIYRAGPLETGDVLIISGMQ